MKLIKCIGPKTVPLGTPERTSALLEEEPFTTTDYDRLARKADIQFKTCFATVTG